MRIVPGGLAGSVTPGGRGSKCKGSGEAFVREDF
jgi:hypothetical protein